MIIIADTTPLHYLIEIEEIHILEELFGRVIIPQAVFDELPDLRTPQRVKVWMQSHPDWLELRQADISFFTPQKIIGAREREAIALALELKADAILMDDKGATREARRLNIRTIPTLLYSGASGGKGLARLASSNHKDGTNRFLPAARSCYSSNAGTRPIAKKS